MPKIIITSDIRKLDKELSKKEIQFKNKLDKYFDGFENEAIRKLSKDAKINIKKTKQEGLEKLYKNYFRDIDKLSSRITKSELYKSSKTQKQKDEILKIVSLKENDYLKRSKELSEKQYNDFLETINNRISEAKKQNPNIKVKDLKKILSRETGSFKNVRSDLTAEYEANRITNKIRQEFAKESGIVKSYVFTATIDDRTTKHICRPRHGIVIAIDSPDLVYYTPPLHARCRSYLVFVYKWSNIKNTSEKKVKQVQKNAPVPKENIKVRDEGFN